MAHKRMFSKDITTSDAFREMPPSSQALYFHLGMEADDDGFLDNYRGLMRAVNASQDDLNILVAKRFLIIFESKVMVIKHWLINNTIRKDRYNETKHLEEKRALLIKENGSYTEHLEGGIPTGNQLATQKRIGKERRVSETKVSQVDEPYQLVDENGDEFTCVKKPPKYKNARTVFTWFPNPQRSWERNTTELDCGNLLYERGERAVKTALRFVAEQEDNPDFRYVVLKPSHLERKWVDIANWKRKQGL